MRFKSMLRTTTHLEGGAWHLQEGALDAGVHDGSFGQNRRLARHTTKASSLSSSS